MIFHCPGPQRALHLHPQALIHLTTRSSKMQGGRAGGTKPTCSEKGRFKGASQFANETTRQNLPKFQHKVLVENNRSIPLTHPQAQRKNS